MLYKIYWDCLLRHALFSIINTADPKISRVWTHTLNVIKISARFYGNLQLKKRESGFWEKKEIDLGTVACEDYWGLGKYNLCEFYFKGRRGLRKIRYIFTRHLYNL